MTTQTVINIVNRAWNFIDQVEARVCPQVGLEDPEVDQTLANEAQALSDLLDAQ